MFTRTRAERPRLDRIHTAACLEARPRYFGRLAKVFAAHKFTHKFGYVAGDGSSSTTFSSMIVARSRAHSSSVIGRSLMMYLPST